MEASRGSIASFPTYRPPLPVDMFSCPVSPSSEEHDEVHLTDGVSYNYNGRAIPAAALKALVTKKPELASECGATVEDVEKGHATGLVLVSERENSLETLHVALRFNGKVKILSLADIYGPENFGGVRMEDSGCIAGGFAPNADLSLVYVSTKRAVEKRRAPWTVVYRTSLVTGETERLTPEGQYDLSPAVSPSGKRVAVANFSGNRWDGEIEHLKTDIVVMNVDRKAQGGKLDRKRIIKDGGWPSWGSDNVIFFHRGLDNIDADGKNKVIWRVFRCDLTTGQTDQVTPDAFNAMTPAAINEHQVAVATIRERTNQMEGQREEKQYRHIEVFDFTKSKDYSVKITQNIFPKRDYYNPFVLDNGNSIGYHRGRNDMMLQQNGKSDVPRKFHKMQSPHKDVGLFRVSGVFPTISSDGSKLAFVDNEFKAVWLADKEGLRVVYERRGPNSVFSTVWNQNPEKDILYVCVGPSFSADKPLEIYAIFNVSGTRGRPETRRLTDGGFNNAFPSSNPDGTKIVFRSTRDHTKSEFRYKNLYIMQDAHAGETFGDGTVTRLTEGDWTDTHCQWSPRGEWIVFSSTRNKPEGPDKKYKLVLDNGLDLGHFAVFLVAVSDPRVVVRVVTSADPGPGLNSIAGHVNHPIFSPDGRSIAFTSDLAAISAEPISMPMFLHSVRAYGDIFSVDIDPDDIQKNQDIKKFHRVTHSRYEYSTPAWTQFATDDPNAQWNMLVTTDAKAANYKPACPYAHPDGGESWHMTGHLILPKRCC